MDAPPVQYVRTSDGWTVAYSVFGEGPPLVVAPVTFHHLQMVWQDGEWGEWLSGLAPQYQIVLHDHRGTGLSGRGLLPDYQPLDRVLDLESVVDCLGLGRFALLAAGSASHPSAVYAARHPHRVAALILISCSVSMRPWPTALHQQLARDNWDSFLYMVAQSPDGLEATSRIVEKRKRMVDQADFLTITHATSSSSIEVELEQVSAPTLVIHPRGVRSPSREDCADVASRIPLAQLVETEGGGFGDLAGRTGSTLAAIETFLANLPSQAWSMAAHPGGYLPGALSTREAEVLRLLAAGRSNQQIADELVISRNTVRRHVSNIFDKTGAANRAQATAYAKDHGIA